MLIYWIVWFTKTIVDLVWLWSQPCWLKLYDLFCHLCRLKSFIVYSHTHFSKSHTYFHDHRVVTGGSLSLAVRLPRRLQNGSRRWIRDGWKDVVLVDGLGIISDFTPMVNPMVGAKIIIPKICFIFPDISWYIYMIWKNHPNWLVYFRGVGMRPTSVWLTVFDMFLWKHSMTFERTSEKTMCVSTWCQVAAVNRYAASVLGSTSHHVARHIREWTWKRLHGKVWRIYPEGTVIC